ncbi:MAG: DNA-binding response regulator [Actinobacteria bacterium HGW-Actinobacteria-7]|jgi:DNA-binding NarL/FixJ family response regulator|nr:MAG: DNA-binding response regulator [Actinobacteria bacterium HGW-Actinobacteria-7]
MDQFSVFIADDHELVRLALRGMIESEDDMVVVGEAADTESAITECLLVSPDVLVLDLRMPGKGGAHVCRKVKESAPAMKVLVLTSFEEDEELFGVLSAGACGYLLKDTPPERIVHAIRAVAEGQAVFDSAVASRVITGRSPCGLELEDPLSDREMEVLSLMARGMSNKAIGKQLWIGETTVKTHVSHILRKLNQADRTQAVLAAVRAGIVDLGN